MSTVDTILAISIIVPWNIFLIYRMRKDNKKNGINNNTPDKER